MPLDWIITQHKQTAQNLHQADCHGAGSEQIKDAVESSIEKAIALLPNNIQDDSLYFLVEWHKDNTTNMTRITIVVTDDSKTKESSEVTTCAFSISDEEQDQYAEKVRYWIRDYLTTSGGFIQFSLVAVLSLGDRGKTELL
jgi:hypothetical protein